LGYVALNVSDVERSAFFYEELWGLQADGQDATEPRFLRCSKDHHNIVLYRATPGLKRLGWRLETDEDLQRLGNNLRKEGLRVREVEAAECRALHQGPTLRFSEPFTGATHEFFIHMDNAADDWTPSVAKIQRVGHVVRGPGRHPPSGSIFLYVLDPDGLTVEYSYGMEEFPEVDFREHRVLPPVPESINLWGGPTDKRLGAIGKIEDISAP
jgi:2,3-dihydroxy-p-cumate/2,3-dihydroxybenzoate 3,4-dioxygenase